MQTFLVSLVGDLFQVVEVANIDCNVEAWVEVYWMRLEQPMLFQQAAVVCRFCIALLMCMIHATHFYT